MEALSLEGARMQREARIAQALLTARQKRVKAFRVDNPTSASATRRYFVYSTSRKGEGYYLTAGQHPAVGGFRYAVGGWWVRCECNAALHSIPCCHGAAVHRRLHREARGLRLVGAVCPRCGSENAPGASTCHVCSQHPQQATAVREREAAPGAGGGPASGYELGDFFAA